MYLTLESQVSEYGLLMLMGPCCYLAVRNILNLDQSYSTAGMFTNLS